MPSVKAYGTHDAKSPLVPMTIERREPRARDVVIDIQFCGVCHSDLHQARDEWKNTNYPCVPGHEIVGKVARTGSDVARHHVGDLVAVGCLVDACRSCASCRAGYEQFCEVGAVFTYNGEDRHGDGITKGGYSKAVVVHEDFVLRMPSGLDPAAAAPLLCAGITTYAPLRKHGVTDGTSVGVVGLGGLGHVGVKIARAMGAHVTVFTTTAAKGEDARRLGAHDVVVSTNAAAMEARAGTLDFVLDTVSAQHDVNVLLGLLRREGTFVLVGAPEEPLSVAAFSLIFGARRMAGSLIGGVAMTQEMLDFCGEHGITADVEIIRMDEINAAYDRLLKSDVRYRFVIDAGTL